MITEVSCDLEKRHDREESKEGLLLYEQKYFTGKIEIEFTSSGDFSELWDNPDRLRWLLCKKILDMRKIDL